MKKSKIYIILIMFLALIAKGTGLIRDVFITYHIGFNYITDAIFVVIPLILLMFSIFNTVIKNSFRTIFSSDYIEKPKYTIEKFKLLRNNLFILFTTLSFLVFIFANIIVLLVVPGVTDETKVLSVYLLRWSIISLIFIGLVNVYNGFLQSIRVYGSEHYISIINNVVFIIIIGLFFNVLGENSIIMAIVLGSIFQYIYIKIKFNKVVTPKARTKNLKVDLKALNNFIKENKFIIYGGGLSQATILLDKFFASFLSVGSITALHYAGTIKNLPVTIILVVLSNMYFTNLAINYKKDRELFKRSVVLQSEKLILLITPLIVFIILNSNDIVNILFNRGNFDEKGVNMIGSALIAYSFGLFLIGLKDVFIKASYVAGNQKIPFRITLISIVLNVVLNFILGNFYGHIGIALATSLSILISAIITVFLFEKHVMKIYTSNQVRYILKIGLIGLLLVSVYPYFDITFLEHFNIYVALTINFIFILILYTLSILILRLHKGSVK